MWYSHSPSFNHQEQKEKKRMSRIHDEFQVAIHLRQLSLQLEMQFTHSIFPLFFKAFETYCSKKKKLDSHSRTHVASIVGSLYVVRMYIDIHVCMFK
jgi:hypothetical protein